MKRIPFASALALVVAVALAGCAEDAPSEAPEGSVTPPPSAGPNASASPSPATTAPAVTPTPAPTPETAPTPSTPTPQPPFVESTENCTFVTTGANAFYILQPGYTMVLEGREDGEAVAQEITVTNETKLVDGVETRIVREHETVDGELEENSWNFVAMCKETGTMFYFGEDVDIYEDGALESHEGAWLAGVDGAEPGILMPAHPEMGSKWFEEKAPGVAEDEVEVVAVDETVATAAGAFTGAIKVRGSSALHPEDVDFKWHAPGVGVVIDGPLRLVRFGFAG